MIDWIRDQRWLDHAIEYFTTVVCSYDDVNQQNEQQHCYLYIIGIRSNHPASIEDLDKCECDTVSRLFFSTTDEGIICFTIVVVIGSNTATAAAAAATSTWSIVIVILRWSLSMAWPATKHLLSSCEISSSIIGFFSNNEKYWSYLYWARKKERCW